jgi:hypothetical protein
VVNHLNLRAEQRVNRYEVYASPQGEEAEVFPEIVVSVEDDRSSAVREAWNRQRETRSDVCLYGIRREVPPEAAE